jgi:hypothetical protein
MPPTQGGDLHLCKNDLLVYQNKVLKKITLEIKKSK